MSTEDLCNHDFVICEECIKKTTPDPERQARERLGMWLAWEVGRSYDREHDYVHPARRVILIDCDRKIVGPWVMGAGTDEAANDFDAINAALDRAEGKGYD